MARVVSSDTRVLDEALRAKDQFPIIDQNY